MITFDDGSGAAMATGGEARWRRVAGGGFVREWRGSDRVDAVALGATTTIPRESLPVDLTVLRAVVYDVLRSSGQGRDQAVAAMGGVLYRGEF